MQLVVLGSGTAAADQQRGAPAFLVVCDADAVLLDCGCGSMQRLARAGIAPAELSAIAITHAHLDHWAELPAILFSLRLPGVQREQPLSIHCSPEMAALLRRVQAELEPMCSPPCGIDWVEHEDDSFQVGALRMRASRIVHHPSSIGFSVRSPAGARIAYVGDCAELDGAIALCRDADVALLECSSTDDEPNPKHLGPAQIATICREAKPGHVLLVHLPPGRDEDELVQSVRAHGCQTPVTAAFDGLGLSLDEDY